MTTDTKPDPSVMTAKNRFHIAYDIGRFVDNEVEAGVRYWYGVSALSADGAQIAYGWHRADAVTDTEPPAEAEPITAMFDNGAVMVNWTQPEDNYELHSYTVFRSTDGDEPEAMATTCSPEQTSFTDDRPPATGTVTYSVVAMDFHWNKSLPAKAEVDLP